MFVRNELIVLKVLTIQLLMLFQQTPVTFTDITYVNGTDSLKVTVRMDYDLFLRDYQQTIFDDISLEDLRSYNPFPSDLANNYVNSKIVIYGGNKLLTGKLLGMEKEGEDIRFRLLYRVGKRLNIISVNNRILTGLTTKVENLTFVRSKKYESWVKFTSDNSEASFILK